MYGELPAFNQLAAAFANLGSHSTTWTKASRLSAFLSNTTTLPSLLTTAPLSLNSGSNLPKRLERAARFAESKCRFHAPQVDTTLRAKSRRFLLVPVSKQMESIRQANETGALCQSCKVLCIPPSKRARRSVAEGSAGAIEHVCAATRGAAGRTQAPIAARTAPVDTCTDWTVRRSAPRCMAIRVWPSCPLPFSDGVALARGRR